MTLSREIERDLETHYWDIKTKDLLNQLRKLTSKSWSNQSTLNSFKSIYSQLMRVHQTRKLPEQIIQEINGYQQISMVERQKLIERERFANLSAKAMNPNVETCYPLPKLGDRDLRLVEKWYHLPRNSLDRTSLIKTRSKDWELGRLLSARSAEKVAADFYQHYEKKVKDISITQIDENSESDWRNYDLNVDSTLIDVKNSRQSRENPDRYTEHCIPRFKHSRKGQDVKIAGVFSPYLWSYTLLEPTEYYGDTTTRFLGQTTWKDLRALKDEFSDLADFEERNLMGRYFLPPWVFDYPEYVYTERNEARKELENFPNLDSLKGAPFEFNLIPVSIAAGIDLTEILGNKVSEVWEQSFLNQLHNRIETYGLSLPFLFLTILEHFLCMAASPQTVSYFDPDRYRKFLFCQETDIPFQKTDNPLGIYDPLKTIAALINVLSILWTAEDELIQKFRVFKLRGFNILQGKSDSNEDLWTTLVAYCGGRLENGSACGKNPLVLGESKHCEYHRLICPACSFCCQKCEDTNKPKQNHSKTLDERSIN